MKRLKFWFVATFVIASFALSASAATWFVRAPEQRLDQMEKLYLDWTR